jgi:hypothetical protein
VSESPKYAIQTTEPGPEWDALVQRSVGGTVFSLSGYLQATGARFELFRALAGSEVKAGCAVLVSPDGRAVVANDFVIHSGIFFEPPRANQKRAVILTERFHATEAFVAFLTERFPGGVHLGLSPQIQDIRPFLWHNYGDADPSRRFSDSLRYTTYLDISSLEPWDLDREQQCPAFLESVYTRRQAIRHARRDQIRAEETTDLDAFISLYAATFARQGIAQSELAPRVQGTRAFVAALLQAKLARIFVVRNRQGKLASGAVFVADAKRAYYLFGGMDVDQQETYTGTSILWDAFHYMRQDGVREIDLEGVNSPTRGWFKLSFGGELVPYHEVRLSP